jgi:hypothetical protein
MKVEIFFPQEEKETHRKREKSFCLTPGKKGGKVSRLGHKYK